MTKSLFSGSCFSIALAALCTLPVGTRAAPYTCANPDIRVEAPDEATAGQVCDSSEKALLQLAACHLPLREQVTIAVVEKVRHPADYDCFAFADCTTENIEVTDPRIIPEITLKDGIYQKIPVGYLFDSLIVHELTHLLIHQSHQDRISETDHEYMAYAMQLQSLPPASRQVFLDQIDPADPIDPARINSFLMMSNPTLFAGLAWAHFSAPENGCAHFERIMNGDATFQIWTY